MLSTEYIDRYWASAFLVTHPLDISLLKTHDARIDKERAGQSKKKTEQAQRAKAHKKKQKPLRARL